MVGGRGGGSAVHKHWLAAVLNGPAKPPGKPLATAKSAVIARVINVGIICVHIATWNQRLGAWLQGGILGDMVRVLGLVGRQPFFNLFNVFDGDRSSARVLLNQGIALDSVAIKEASAAMALAEHYIRKTKDPHGVMPGSIRRPSLIGVIGWIAKCWRVVEAKRGAVNPDEIFVEVDNGFSNL